MWISSVIFTGTCSLKTALFLKVYESKKKLAGAKIMRFMWSTAARQAQPSPS